MFIKLCRISVTPPYIWSTLFMNFKHKSLILFKRKLNINNNNVNFQQLIDILRNKLMLCLLIPTPGFPHLYYMLSANLGSLLHGDVFVIFMGTLVKMYEFYEFCLKIVPNEPPVWIPTSSSVPVRKLRRRLRVSNPDRHKYLLTTVHQWGDYIKWVPNKIGCC